VLLSKIIVFFPFVSTDPNISTMNGLQVVVGASGAMGRALCQLIVQGGGTPVLVGRSAEKLQSVNDEFCNGQSRIVANLDFSTTDAGPKLAQELKGEALQGLTYAVGSITLKSIQAAKPADFLTSYQLNVLGAVQAIQACLPGLKQGAAAAATTRDDNHTSSIVLFSSV
jgi:NADP-dependent 3-hydroxy acid dehydrogenase YdfG